MAVTDPPAVTLPTPSAPPAAPPSTRPGAVLPEARQVVLHVPEKRRYEVHVGGRRAGFTEYFESEGRRVFVHTEVGQAFSGRGLASAVVRHALEQTRTDGRRAAAICPFVSRWVAAHPEFDDVVVQRRP
ncbi:GNAT family N-acetyltransferase [Quadrisphaera oryzae]|uniref:GNAT family N-acetyltransferase n=1 Tax=Quadrisphaera TaxID=317661 RepID=UPI0016441AFA|nr:GNAT family N-acetyltransferase [Quadrisphaera sp. RL12-1S]MBC3763348.1 N-acetyltransferase [Quadrisphaera sp. RL12-1S]